MFVDAQNLFSDAQTITTGSENGILSTNVVDLGSARDIGTGETIYAVVLVDTAFTSSGSDDTVKVELLTDAYAALNSPVVVQEIGIFPVIAAAGTVLICPLKPSAAYEQYIGLRYTAATGPLTAGAVTGFLTKNIDKYRSYPKGYAIS